MISGAMILTVKVTRDELVGASRQYLISCHYRILTECTGFWLSVDFLSLTDNSVQILCF
jgi:hypothetical protein